ncbi:hypothetical protein PoB_006994900 [Plakobranchus ocellatus]|uniref:Uncharacterized protein n=1 Tax=Plakobranchus ocellatus TaxID=259542 RepID=A0AAV4DGS8_9GAST|nr:hypothetical protein PoB_006994900 [Plakobranchus ocellatus]
MLFPRHEKVTLGHAAILGERFFFTKTLANVCRGRGVDSYFCIKPVHINVISAFQPPQVRAPVTWLELEPKIGVPADLRAFWLSTVPPTSLRNRCKSRCHAPFAGRIAGADLKVHAMCVGRTP